VSLVLSDFDFELPERLIARYPARPRDAARLLVVRPERLEDRQVGELPAILRPAISWSSTIPRSSPPSSRAAG
jgi:S-adenosylmethionine:tRNA-ribosyltransferase-isomerase (queuine synthetase)